MRRLFRYCGLVALAGCLAIPAGARAEGDSGPLARWSALWARSAAQAPAPCSDDISAKDCRYAAWLDTLDRMKGMTPQAQIAAVQAGVGALPYVRDAHGGGQADHWQTPVETFARGGDCEDHAIAKFAALRRLGFAEGALRLLVVWDSVDREQHAVLTVDSGGMRWMLDNKLAAPVPADDYAARYRPIYEIHAGRLAVAAAGLGAERIERRGGRETLVFRARAR